MPTRIEEILTRARDTLADPNAERWSDARLIRLIDEGQKDVAKHTRILKGYTAILPFKNGYIYDLPEDVWMITRAAWESCKIPLVTHDELDELVRNQVVNNHGRAGYENTRGTSFTSNFDFGTYCWELDVGNDIEALVYDRRNMHKVRTYPIYDPGSDPVVFGIITFVQGYEFTSPFGVVTNIVTNNPLLDVEFSSPYGVVTADNIFTDAIVFIWYIKIPTTVTLITDELELPALWDTILKHYVVSHAFDDDYDTQFEAKSAKAAALYQRELALIAKTDNHDGVRDGSIRSDYRGAFER